MKDNTSKAIKTIKITKLSDPTAFLEKQYDILINSVAYFFCFMFLKQDKAANSTKLGFQNQQKTTYCLKQTLKKNLFSALTHFPFN